MGNGTISNSYNNTSYKYTIRLINYTIYSVIILSDFVIGTIGHRVSGYIVTNLRYCLEELGTEEGYGK